jgi:hypothetical protein
LDYTNSVLYYKTKQMDLRGEIESECRRLNSEFRSSEMQKYSDHCYTYDDGERFLQKQYWEQLKEKCTHNYYEIYIEKLWNLIHDLEEKIDG